MYKMTIELKDGTKQVTTWGDTEEYLLGMICKLYKEDIYEKIEKISLKRIAKKGSRGGVRCLNLK